MSFHFIVQFEPRPGKAAAFREALLRIIEPTRAEAGCLSQHVFEAVREPLVFAVHSEWVDEAAFELHAQLPHTLRFLEEAGECLTQPVKGLRLRELGGGPGTGHDGSRR